MSNKSQSELTEKFNKIYSDVFDSKGEITACGRDKCIQLIITAREICPNKQAYGNLINGFIDVQQIHKLHEEVNR